MVRTNLAMAAAAYNRHVGGKDRTNAADARLPDRGAPLFARFGTGGWRLPCLSSSPELPKAAGEEVAFDCVLGEEERFLV